MTARPFARRAAWAAAGAAAVVWVGGCAQGPQAPQASPPPAAQMPKPPVSAAAPSAAAQGASSAPGATRTSSASGATNASSAPGGPGAPLGRLADTPQERATFQARSEAMRTGGESRALYAPLEAVPGVAPRKPFAPAREPTIDAAALASARQLAEQSASRALLVWRRGALELEAYFAGAGADTPLVSRSLAKPLATLAVGRAMALGHIRSLDQPVSDFIPEWKSDARRSRILLRHLLDMRSGLLPQGMPSGPDDVLNRAYLHPRHDEVIVTEYPVPDEPGTRFEYSNANSSLVARIIERATGQRYAAFIGNELMRPLGAAPGEVWLNREGGLAHSGCCLLTPADTWLRVAVLMLREGVWEGRRLLPEGFVREVRTPTAQNPYFGLGVFVAGRYIERRSWGNPASTPIPGVLHGEPYLAADLYLFDGNANQVVYIVPSEELVIVRVGERPPRTPEWDNARLPNLVLRGITRERGASTPQPR